MKPEPYKKSNNWIWKIPLKLQGREYLEKAKIMADKYSKNQDGPNCEEAETIIQQMGLFYS